MRPYCAHAGVTIYHGDCREVLPLLAGSNVALIVTDPPYRSLDEAVSRGTTTRLIGGRNRGHGRYRGPAWFPTLSVEELTLVLAEARQLLVHDGALYVFSDVKTGLKLFPGLSPTNVLVWDKQRIGMGYSWRRMHEWIAYCPNRKHRLRSRSLGDIIRAPAIREKQHPTEKPVAVLSVLIANSSDADDVVLDPFMGSGATLRTAKSLGRRAVGIEIDERYCEIAAESLRHDVSKTLPTIAPVIPVPRRSATRSAPSRMRSSRRRVAVG